jgi:hypothetical protein
MHLTQDKVCAAAVIVTNDTGSISRLHAQSKQSNVTAAAAAAAVPLLLLLHALAACFGHASAQTPATLLT